MRRIVCLATLLCLSVALVEYSFAVTAYPDPIRIIQPDGTPVTVILQGDERVRWARSPDGYTLIYNGKGVYEYAIINPAGDLLPSGVKARDSSDRTQKDNLFLAAIPKGLFYSQYQVNILKQAWKTMKSGGPQHAFPTKGNRKLLCILIGYTDKPFTKTRTDFQNLFNQVGYNVDGARGSVKDYFAESSYNQLNLTTDVAGPYTAKNTAEYYGANNSADYDARARELVAEAIQMADADVNYADYDNDGDGAADGVHVIFAGYGEEAGGGPNCIWSHAWEIPPVTCDGISISQYSCSPELRSFFRTELTRIGSICHEFGHILGAPDFYDIDYETGGLFNGTGSWDLQGAGGWNAGGASPAHSNPYI
ncbi:MAG: M6 family metalloprotease domain-containing protein, partial [Bacteroidia bacterium]|nr:M6 family metalloprotease domain-containing protein [Bacteroidia bacterium]